MARELLYIPVGTTLPSGYTTMTTFYMDFSIAEIEGETGVLDTYKRAFDSWHTDTKYITELVIVLNMKCWHHHEHGNIELSKVYADLYYKLNDWCYENLTGEDLQYYFECTD